MQQRAPIVEMTAEEAAEFLGIEQKALPGVLERYGVGRYYVARAGEQFVYSRRDIEKVKNDLEAAASGAAPAG